MEGNKCKLGLILEQAGFSVSNLIFSDPELSFNGLAPSEILKEWLGEEGQNGNL